MGLDDWARRWATRATGPTHDHQPPPVRPLTAAGAPVNLRQPAMSHTRREKWQEESWSYREKIPEMRFAGDFVANTLGRLRVFPAENRPRGEEPVPLEAATRRQQNRGESGVDQHTIDAAVAACERLNLDQHGSSMLSRIAENFEYAGECFLVREPDDETADYDSWSVRSVSELQVTQGGARVVDPDSGMQQRELREGEADVMRLWTPHPRFYDRPDAPVAALLDVLERMYLLGQRERAHSMSRISSGRGLFIPDEFLMMSSGQAPVSSDMPGEAAGEHPMMVMLREYMTAAITDPGDPSAVVPLLITGPGMINDTPSKDVIGTFDLHGEDPKDLHAQYEANVLQFARGVNLSPERVKGLGDTNNWQANVITADEIKNAVEPRAERIMDSLVAAYLSRMLRGMGISPAQRRKVCLWFDPSELVQNPNRGEDAKALHQAGELSGDALRHAHGFTDADRPTTQERLLRALTQGELANDAVPAILALANGRVPTVQDLTALQQEHARIAAPRPTIDVTPNRPTPASPAGSPPKRIDPTPPVGQRTQPATAAQPGAAVTAAAATRQWRLDRELGRRLARVDADFTTRVLAHADTTTGRAIERAAARARAANQATAAGKARFAKGSDPRAILAAGGRGYAAGLSDDQLLDGAFDDLETLFVREADHAAAAVEAILDKRLPAALTAAAGRGIAERIRANTSAAWSWLHERLREHALAVLFAGRQPARGGDTNLGVTPASLVRGAAAILGGLDERGPGLDDTGVPLPAVDGTPRAATGPGTGDVALSRLTQVGALELGFEWDHHPGVNQFPGHRRLDGVFFTGPLDAALAVSPGDVWLGRSHYAPGDHQGCACQAHRAFAIPLTDGADPQGPEVAAMVAELAAG